jgi:hypothetical protein
MYSYETIYGVFSIVEDPRGWYALFLNEEKLGSYPSPRSAAETVSAQSTGSAAWDLQQDAFVPPDLSEWSKTYSR